MANFALEDGVFISTEDELEYDDLPAAFELVIRGVIHRKAYGKDVEFFVLEFSEQLQELFQEEPIIGFTLRKLHKVKEIEEDVAIDKPQIGVKPE